MDKEIKVRNTLMVGVILSAVLFSPHADAARQKSSNRIFFDAAGNIVGQEAFFCNNVHLSGGDLTSPIQLYIKGGCGDILVSCDGQGNCSDDGIDNAIDTSLIGSPPFTKQEACDLSGACQSTEPEIMYGHGFEID